MKRQSELERLRDQVLDAVVERQESLTQRRQEKARRKRASERKLLQAS